MTGPIAPKWFVVLYAALRILRKVTYWALVLVAISLFVFLFLRIAGKV